MMSFMKLFISTIILQQSVPVLSDKTKCFVYDADTRAVCEGDVNIIPPDLPHTLREINFDNVFFINPVLSAANFSSYPNLTRIEMTKCNITSIHPDTFSRLPNLRVLNLNGNILTKVHDGTFSGLHLQELNLGGNENLTLTENMFRGIRIPGGKLHLDKINVDSLNPNVFYPLMDQLSELAISGNRIAHIPFQFKSMFQRLESINLLGNPLKCSCSTFWLQQLCKYRPEAFVTTSYSEERSCPLLCHLPLVVQNRRLSELSLVELECQPAEVQGVDVALASGGKGTLRCKASGHPIPTLSLMTVNGDRIENQRTGWWTDGVQTTMELNGEESVICEVSSEITGPKKLSIHLQWPKEIDNHINKPHPLVSSTRYPYPEKLGNKLDISSPKPSLVRCDPRTLSKMSEKFTMIDLVIAIISSSAVTILACLVACYWVYRRSYEKAKLRCESKIHDSICQAKENLYTMISAEERERLSASRHGKSHVGYYPIRDHQSLSIHSGGGYYDISTTFNGIAPPLPNRDCPMLPKRDLMESQYQLPFNETSGTFNRDRMQLCRDSFPHHPPHVV